MADGRDELSPHESRPSLLPPSHVELSNLSVLESGSKGRVSEPTMESLSTGLIISASAKKPLALGIGWTAT